MNYEPDFEGIRWRPWNEDAFVAGRQDGKPILLTLTATWCHWCHVMDQTSYSDPQVINRVNSQFIPVRVDVDRRPDIGRRYNQGGYPSVVILDGHGDLITGRVYMPPDQMVRFLEQAVSNYSVAPPNLSLPVIRAEASSPAQQLVKNFQDSSTSRVLGRLQELYDPDFGGFGGEPKQPPWEGLRFFMALYSRLGDKRLRDMVTNTLDAMKGGLYDQRDQGFFRYSVARDWKVPHYEKMVAGNANLSVVYLEAYQLTRRKSYKDAADGALACLLNTFYDQTKGTFCASQDAWEDYYRLPWKDREGALKPPVDDTAYTGWNALAATALVKAYGVLGTASYLKVAATTLELLWNTSWHADHGLAHVTGRTQEQPLFLEDHVLFVRGLLDLYQATGQLEQLHRAAAVLECIQRLFGAPDGGFYDTFQVFASPSELLAKEKPIMENSLLAEALLVISGLTGEDEYQAQASNALRLFEAVVPGGSYLGPKHSRRMEEDEEQLFLPAGSAWARACDMLSRRPVHLVIVGSSSNAGTQRLLKAALKTYAPHRIVQLLDPERDMQRIGSLGFPAQGGPTLYACMDGICLAPITNSSTAREVLTHRPWAAR